MMERIMMTLMAAAAFGLAAVAGPGEFNTVLPRLHWEVSEAEEALFADLKNLGAGKSGLADCPDEVQMAKIHQDEKRLDEAVNAWEKANE
jgi:hypothetical protein